MHIPRTFNSLVYQGGRSRDEPADIAQCAYVHNMSYSSGGAARPTESARTQSSRKAILFHSHSNLEQRNIYTIDVR